MSDGTGGVPRAHYQVRHVTTYRYSTDVSFSQTVAHLLPRATPRQSVLRAELHSDPPATDRFDYADAFGNPSSYLAVELPHDRWELTAACEVALGSPPEPVGDIAWQEVVELVRTQRLAADVVEMAMGSTEAPVEPSLATFAREVVRDDAGVVDSVVALTQHVFEQCVFDPAATDVSTPVLSVLEQRRGVCQDFAHLMVGCLRSLGLPARYVSGYLETDPPPGATKLVGADASHAWVSVFVPGYGWLDADPTNGTLPRDRHITVAWGRDYTDVAPARGVVFGPPSTQQLDVAVDVRRVG